MTVTLAISKELPQKGTARQSATNAVTGLTATLLESALAMSLNIQNPPVCQAPAQTAYDYAASFVDGIYVGANEWRDLRGWTETTYGLVTGFVYFIAIGKPYITHLKIGFTTGDPAKRLAGLQTGCPFKMTMVGYVMGNPTMETELHRVLDDDRCEGEWFARSDYVARTVLSILEQPYEDTLA